ncbi:MAG TPA: methyltransferase domain-containing protein [Ktedonobacterales bacterium]|nr:methyltransferase domain-containing protein [Ktedonobacterales bacterium]
MDWFNRSLPGAGAGRGTATNLSNSSGRWLAAESARPEAAPYLLPRDDNESRRQDFQHYVLRSALRGLFAAPLVNLTHILDVGCGTGQWGLEMASLFPQARVTGIDLEPRDMYAQSGPRPLNYSAVRANILEGLQFASGLFDYVHMRQMLLAIPADQWPRVIAELVRLTRPLGWIELMEEEAPSGGGPALHALIAWTRALCQSRGLDPTLVGRIGDFLREAGVREVTVRRIELPIGGRGGRLGAMMATSFTASMESLLPGIVTAGLATPREAEDVRAAIPLELNQWQCVQPFTIAFGMR